MEPICFRFALTKDDYVKSSRSRGRGHRVFFRVCGLFFLAIMVVFKAASPNLSMGWLVWPVLLLTVAILLYNIIFKPVTMITIGGNKQPSYEEVWSLDDENIVTTTELAENKTAWDFYAGVTETQDHYHMNLASNNQLYQIIPKRAFESPEQEAAFRDLVTRQGLTIKSPGRSGISNPRG